MYQIAPFRFSVFKLFRGMMTTLTWNLKPSSHCPGSGPGISRWKLAGIPGWSGMNRDSCAPKKFFIFPLLSRSAPGLDAGCHPFDPGLARLIYGVAPVSFQVHPMVHRLCPSTSRWHPDRVPALSLGDRSSPRWHPDTCVYNQRKA